MAFSEVLALLIVVTLFCAYVLTTYDLKFDTISVEKVATSHVISTSHFALLRLSFSAVIWSLCGFLLFDTEGLKLDVLMRDGSNKKLHLFHAERFSPFTVWCWIIQGCYFTITGVLSLLHADLLDFDPALTEGTKHLMCQVSWVLFELCFSTAFLVTSIVSYVLIPATKKRKLPLDNFFMICPLVMHNFNVIFMAVELTLNKLDFAFYHFPYALLYGCIYIVFAWGWFQYKGIFYYFFLDYMRDGALLWHVGLILVLLACFSGGYQAALYVNQGSIVATTVLFAVTFMVLRLAQ